MKTKKLSKKELKNIGFEITDDGGFVLWFLSRNKEGRSVRHWILDGSELRTTGKIHIGDPLYDVSAIFKNNHIQILEIIHKNKS